MEWTGEKLVKLIELYERNPVLYDVKSEDYHNRDEKATKQRARTNEKSDKSQRTWT
jgi:hypothetical protein